MKKILQYCVIAFISFYSSAFALPQPIIVTSESLNWLPANDLKGAEVAVIYGNPMKKGPFIARIKLPAGLQVPVHTHNINEYDTVISGALYVGIGNQFDSDHMQKISAGGFIMIPAKVPHYTMTKEETILQINGMGPWGMIYKKHV